MNRINDIGGYLSSGPVYRDVTLIIFSSIVIGLIWHLLSKLFTGRLPLKKWGKTTSHITKVLSQNPTLNFALLIMASVLLIVLLQSKGYLANSSQKLTDTEPVTIPVVTPAYYLLTSDLAVGAVGDDVKILQSALSTGGYISLKNVTGNYGDNTVTAVKAFQIAKDLDRTGIFDSTTRQEFNSTYGQNSREYYLEHVYTDTYQAPKNNTIYADTNNNTSDPIVKCTIGQSCAPMQIKKSECLTYSVCCLVGGNTHVPVKTLDDCIRAQNAYSQGNGGSQSNTTTNTNQTTTNTTNILINCSYSNGQYQFDFGQLTYDACKIKTDQYWAGKSVVVPTYSNVIETNPTPIQPTSDSRCSEASNEWVRYRDDFLANKINNYSNSAEAMIALEKERQYIQSLINSYGCSLTLR